MFQSISNIINNVTGIIKQKGDGTNQSINDSVYRKKRLKLASNISERINRIVLQNIDKFDKKNQKLLKKYIYKFDSLD